MKRRGRLQRNVDFTGDRITTFAAVFYRHGLPCALLAVAFLLDPRLRLELSAAFSSLLLEPRAYVFGATIILLGLITHSVVTRSFSIHSLSTKGSLPSSRYVGWIVYLGLLSVWEEWVFRLGIPFYLQLAGLGFLPAILLSNVIFGAMHYFTLRWKWYWCVIAGVGGVGFSYHFHNHGNLAFIAGIHWVATYLNTPSPPKGAH